MFVDQGGLIQKDEIVTMVFLNLVIIYVSFLDAVVYITRFARVSDQALPDITLSWEVIFDHNFVICPRREVGVVPLHAELKSVNLQFYKLNRDMNKKL